MKVQGLEGVRLRSAFTQCVYAAASDLSHLLRGWCISPKEGMHWKCSWVSQELCRSSTWEDEAAPRPNGLMWLSVSHCGCPQKNQPQADRPTSSTPGWHLAGNGGRHNIALELGWRMVEEHVCSEVSGFKV